jgi:hypothetical protein
MSEPGMTNMKKYKVLLMITVVIGVMTTSCSRGLKVVPEISTNLYDENVLELTGKEVASKIIKHKSELVFVTIDGKVYRWDPKARIMDFLYNLNHEIDPNSPPVDQGDFLAMKLKPPGQGSRSPAAGIVVFDLNRMKEAAVLKKIPVKKIVGLDREILVYITEADELIFYNYRTQSRLSRMPLTLKKDASGKVTKAEVFNCAFKGDNVFVLTGTILYAFNRQRKTISSYLLKHPAASGFLMDGDWLYYGSRKRELIKLSSRSNRTAWRFQVADTLRIAPCKVGPYIVIIPEDNNIYFFNKNGTLYWWYKLNSTRLLPPLPMKENAAVFLWDKKIKFFNYKKKQVVTYPLKPYMVVRSNAVQFGEYIYFVLEDRPETELEESDRLTFKRLSKIGNHYDVEVNAVPQFIWPKGKSIKFRLKNVNFVKPRYNIKIYKQSTVDAKGKEIPVFEKTISKAEGASFLWIPKEAIEYRMVIEVNAENKKGVYIEEQFEAIDIDKALANYYYELHRLNGPDS